MHTEFTDKGKEKPVFFDYSGGDLDYAYPGKPNKIPGTCVR